jgi:hypothetical protein
MWIAVCRCSAPAGGGIRCRKFICAAWGHAAYTLRTQPGWEEGDQTDRTERTDPWRVWEVEKARVGIPGFILGIGGLKNGELWKVAQINRLQKLERVKGIEPSPQAWEARVLPLNYTRFAKSVKASEGRIRFKVQVWGVPSFQIPVPSGVPDPRGAPGGGTRPSEGGQGPEGDRTERTDRTDRTDPGGDWELGNWELATRIWVLLRVGGGPFRGGGSRVGRSRRRWGDWVGSRGGGRSRVRAGCVGCAARG